MRSFNANFITEKNKRADGPMPINLLTFNFATPVYISDRDITPSGGSLHQGLIKEWGYIDTSIAQTPGKGILGNIEISDLQLKIINTTSPPFSDSFTSEDPPENVTVELYQWFEGLAYSEKELFFKGVIRGQPKYDLYTCTITVQGNSKKYNKLIGEDLIINAADFPNADPDDIGKMRNIGYGSLANVPCRAIKAGAVDTLRDDLDDSTNNFYVSGASKADFPSGTVVVQIDDEKIQGTYSQTNKRFTSCTRGYDSTTAEAHNKGASAAEILTEYIYEALCHPAKSIGDVRVDDVKQTAGYTAYTGQSGDELAGYEATAVIKFTVLPVLKKQVNVEVDDGIGVTDNISYVIGGTTREEYPDDHGGAASCDDPTNAYDGATSTFARVVGGTYYWTFPSTSYGTIVKQYYEVLCDGVEAAVAVRDEDGNDIFTPNSFDPPDEGSADRFRFTTTDTGWDTGIRFDVDSAPARLRIFEIRKIVQYTPDATKSGGASKTGTATLVGNSVADTVIGKLIAVDLEAYQDDALGTYTGTPNALIERPDHIKKHIWCEILGAPSGDVDTTTFNAAGTFYSTNSYTFALLINKPILAEALLMKLAFQCRSRFFVTSYGKAKLIVREISKTSVHSILKNEIKENSVSIERSSFDDLLNYFNIHFNIDYTTVNQQTGKSALQPADFKSVTPFQDASSISKYGQKEYNGDLFLFDAVRLSAMVTHVGNYYLDYHSAIKKITKFGVFLDNMEIEQGDVIDITHPLDNMSGFNCEILKINHNLGSGRQGIIDHLEIVAIEN